MALLQFGQYRLDTGRRLLWRDDQEVHLTPKAIDLLILLIDNQDRAVTKEQIANVLWPGTFVSDSSLVVLVRGLRRALQDAPRASKYIRTMHRVGYAFCGAAVAVSTEVPGRAGELVSGNRHYPLNPGVNVVGRAFWPESVDALTVSRRHASIVIDGDRATIEDLGSRNGTFVRGLRIEGPTRIDDGEEIRLGSARCMYRRRAVDATTEAPVPERPR